MAFNEVVANAGSGGSHFAVNSFTDTDSVTRAIAYSQLAFGSAGVSPTVVDATHGLPVALVGTSPISAASLPLPTGASTEATLSTLNGKITACNTGAVVVASGTITVGNATLAVTQSGTWNVSTLTSITNVVHIDDNAGSLTIDGTVTANAGTGTFAVSAASLPLPSGAATAAKQPALGTAGTASVDVLTVQGIAAMTALKVDGSAVTQPVSGTFWQATQPVNGTVTANIGTSGSLMLDATGAKLNIAQGAALGSNTGPMIQGSVTTAAPTYTAGQVSPFSLTVAGALRVDNSGVTQPISAASLPLPSGASTEATLSTLNGKVTACNTGAVVISSGTVTTVSTVTSLTQFNGNAIDTNSGVKSAGTLRVVLATDQPALTNKLLVTPDANSAVNIAQLAGTATAVNTGTASAGTLRVVLATDQPTNTNALKVDGSAVTQPVSIAATLTVNPGNTANSTPWLVSDTAATSGGTSLPYSFLSTAAVQAANIKNSAGQVYALHFFNLSATPVFVRLYNQTTTPGTGDTPVYRGFVPGNTAAAGFVVPIPPGTAFGTGIGIRVTGAVADNDNTALAANTVAGNVFYK